MTDEEICEVVVTADDGEWLAGFTRRLVEDGLGQSVRRDLVEPQILVRVIIGGIGLQRDDVLVDEGAVTVCGAAPGSAAARAQGAGVVTTRAHVRTVATEWGVAELFGRSLRERAKAGETFTGRVRHAFA